MRQEIPEGWKLVHTGNVKPDYKIWDILLGWISPKPQVGKPVSWFDTVIEREWGPNPEPGDKYSFGGREMLFVDTANSFTRRQTMLIWFEPEGWLVMALEDFHTGPIPQLVSKGHDVPKYPHPRTPTTSTF